MNSRNVLIGSKRGLVATMVLVVVSVVPLALTIASADAQPGAIAENTTRLLDYANRERAARGIPLLSRDPRLDAIAQRWAEYVAASGNYGHNLAGLHEARRLGYPAAGENIHERFEPIEANYSHNAWMESGPHRKNLLSPDYQAVGFGLACSTASGRPYYIAVEDFGGDGNRRLETIPPPSPHVAGTDAIASTVDCVNDVAPAPVPFKPAAAPPLPPPAPKAPPVIRQTVRPVPAPPATVPVPPPVVAVVAPAPQPEHVPLTLTNRRTEAPAATSAATATIVFAAAALAGVRRRQRGVATTTGIGRSVFFWYPRYRLRLNGIRLAISHKRS